MKKIATCLFLATLAYCGAAQTGTSSCSGMSLGTNGSLNGFVPSPTDAWHQDISASPVDPNSRAYMATSPTGFKGYYLHPDFGSTFGIPYSVVDSSITPSVPVKMVMYASDSDQTLYPLPPNQPVEGGMPTCPFDIIKGDGNDHHVIAIDRNKCVSYETWVGSYCSGNWSAANGAIWDLTKSEQRPYSLTSVDAAGLSVFAGLIRYDEILAGQINHAIRFTSKYTSNNGNNGCFTAPATHAAGTSWADGNGDCIGPNNQPPILGMRIRLNANFDISKFSQTNQVILKAMKQYGMILADNGSNLFFQGTPDSRWNDDDLNALKTVPASAFDVVKMSQLYDSSNAPTGAAPTINSFTASSTQIAPGTSVTLTPTVTNGSYNYIDVAGFVRGPVTVTPTATTTYTLTSRNAYGTSTASVTVKVNAAAPPAVVVQSVAISPLTTTGNVYTFAASAKLSNNTTQDVTRASTWTSSNPSIATVSNGTLLFQTSGTVSITAQDAGVPSPPVTIRAIIPLRIKSSISSTPAQ